MYVSVFQKLLRPAALLFFFGVLVAGCTQEAQEERSVRLAFNYSPGERYVYEMLDDVEYETTRRDGEVTRVLHQQKQISEIKVLEPDSVENIYNLFVSFTVVFDTLIYPEGYTGEREQKSKDLIGRVNKYTLAMRHDGEIVFVRGKDESATEYYESAYKTRQPVFPKKAIKPGYKWKHTIYLSIPDNEPIPVVIKYRFAGYGKVDEHECAIIEYFSQFEKSSDLTATRWNEKNQFKEWLAHYTTESEGKLYFAYHQGIVAKTVATISMHTEYDIVEKDGTNTQFYRKTVDVEHLSLISINRDSASLTNSKIFY